MNSIPATMTRLLVPTVLALTFAIFFHIPLLSATRTSSQSGPWNATSTWGGSSVPVAGDVVNIRYGHTVSIPAGYSASCTTLNVGTLWLGFIGGAEAILSFAASNSALTVSGGIILGATLLGNTPGSISMSSGGSFSAASISVTALGTWTPGAGTVTLTGTNTLPSQINSFHNLTLNGATTASANISLTGNWTNNASFVQGTYGVTFQGSGGVQDMAGAAATTFNNLTINNADGVQIVETGAGTTSVNSGLTLTSGNIYLRNAGLVIAGGGSVATSAPTSGGWCVTDNTGAALTRNGICGNSSPYLLPVGTADAYNGIFITNNASTPVADNFTAHVRTGFDAGSPPYSSAVVNRQWTITEGTAGGTNATLQFVWEVGDEGAGFIRNNPLFVGRWNGSSWEPSAAAVVTSPATNYYTTSASGYTSFSPFGISNSGALPVELTSFSARLKGADAELKWTTATELNNYGFEIERSADRATWRNIGFVKGHGSSSSPKNYEYIDLNVDRALPSTYYRLKQLDRDGTSEYSSIVEVTNKANGYRLSQNYPNPFSGQTTISYTLPQSENVTVRVHDLLGTEIATLANGTQNAGTYSHHLDPVRLKLQPGYYICTMQAGSFRATRTVLFLP